MKSPRNERAISVGLKVASVPQSWLTLGCFDGSGNRTMTLVAFIPCLTHDLRSAAVLDMGAGAFGTGGATAGAAGAEAAALA